MTKFKDWFSNNLTVGPMPDMNKWYELKGKCFDIVINVSDEHNWNMINTANGLDIHYFWFCMNEHTAGGDIGLNSIFGAMFTMFEAEKQGKRIYLHCHAGANRSPTVADCYFYMRTGKHRNNSTVVLSADMMKMFPDLKSPKLSGVSNNRLINNINQGYLPARNKMEKFLKECNIAFEAYITEGKSISLDDLKLRAHI